MNAFNTFYKNTQFVCIKETSPRDVSFTHTKLLFDRKKNAKNIFGVCIHMSTFLYLAEIWRLLGESLLISRLPGKDLRALVDIRRFAE